MSKKLESESTIVIESGVSVTVSDMTARLPKQEFADLFIERAGSFICYGSASKWNAVSQFHVLSDGDIGDCVSMNFSGLRAVRLGEKTRLIVLRLAPVDALNGLTKLLKQLKIAGLTASKVAHLESDAYYVYVLLAEEASTDAISSKLQQWLDLVLPEVHVVTSSDVLCLPLQQNFSWVNAELKVIASRKELETDGALSMFLADLRKTVCEPQELLNQLEQLIHCAEQAAKEDRNLQAWTSLAESSKHDSIELSISEERPSCKPDIEPATPDLLIEIVDDGVFHKGDCWLEERQLIMQEPELLINQPNLHLHDFETSNSEPISNEGLLHKREWSTAVQDDVRHCLLDEASSVVNRREVVLLPELANDAATSIVVVSAKTAASVERTLDLMQKGRRKLVINRRHQIETQLQLNLVFEESGTTLVQCRGDPVG